VVKEPKAFSLPTLEKKVEELKQVRNKYAKWLMCLGYAKLTLEMLQKLRKDCGIWTGRASFYQASNIDPQARVALEKLEALQWEILMMIRLVPSERLPTEFKGKEPYGNGDHWFAKADEGNTGVLAPSSAPQTTAKVAPVYQLDEEVNWDKIFDDTYLPLDFEEPHNEVIVQDDIKDEKVEDVFSKKDLTPTKGSTATTSSDERYPYESFGVSFYQDSGPEMSIRDDLLGEFAKLAPLRRKSRKSNAHALGIVEDKGEIEAEQDPNATVVVSSGDNKKTLFTGSYLSDRIPRTNLQTGAVPDLYKLGKTVQRYAEMRDCNPQILLDTIVAHTEPNDRNLEWLTKHFSLPYSERKKFFAAYRKRILPFFDLAALTECAVKFNLTDTRQPARIVGSEYIDHMKPYLMLAKSPKDREATENLMKSRFWNYLGIQARQPFEAMLMQSNVNPYKLTLESIVETLKSYSLIQGGELYAQPTDTSQMMVMSMRSKITNESKPNRAEGGKEFQKVGQGREANQEKRAEDHSRLSNGRKTVRFADEIESKSEPFRKQRPDNPRNAFSSQNRSQMRQTPYQNNGNFPRPQNRYNFGNFNRNQQVAAVHPNAMGGFPYSQVMGDPNGTFPRNNRPYPFRISNPSNATQDPSGQINALQGKPNNQGQRNTNNRGAAVPPPRFNSNARDKNNGSFTRSNQGGFGGNFRKTNTAAAIETKENGTSRAPIVCYSCGNSGHMASECKVYRDSYNPEFNYKHACSSCGERGHMFSKCPKSKGN
jgi:hypothetical protein